MITAGSVRGKCWAPQFGQAMALPAERGSQPWPQTPQKRWRVRQCIRPRAWASIEASPGRQQPRDGAQVVEGAEALGQEGQRVLGRAAIDREDGGAVAQAEQRPGAARHQHRLGGLAREEHGLGRAQFDAAQEALRAPDGGDEGGGVGEGGGDEGLVVAPVRHAVERAAGVGVGAAGGDGEHGGRKPRTGGRRGQHGRVPGAMPGGAAEPCAAWRMDSRGPSPIFRRGRPVADGRLVNPVRSGRKQPRRVTARVVAGLPPPSAPASPLAPGVPTRSPGGPGRPNPAARMTSDTDLSTDASDELPEPPMEGPGLFGDPDPAPAVAAAPATAAAPRPLPRPSPRSPTACWRGSTGRRTFNDLIGQEALVRTLRNAFAQNRVAHAFMLTGVRGVGKTTTARIIARALNCIGPDGKGGPTADPCGVCPECRAILADRHPDVLELDAASNNSVDNVREIREAVRFRPSQGRFKVYILDEVHMLSGGGVQRAAQDAGGAAAAGEVPLRHDGDPQGPGDHPLALPALRPAPRAAGDAARALRRHRGARRGRRSSRRRWR